ncbi:MAG: HupE/UreJ family protein [Thermoanaerobaculia bacterium]
MRRSAIRSSLAAGLLLLAAPAAGHQFGTLQVEVEALRGSGLVLRLTIDPEHLAPGIVPLETAAEHRGEAALAALADGLEATSAGAPLALAPLSGEDAWTTTPAAGGTLLHRRYRLELPPGAAALSLGQRLRVGAFVVRAPAIEGVEAPLHWVEGGGSPVQIRFGEPVRPPTRSEVFARYSRLGFEHILPRGLDHICFVLGLFLLSTRWRPLLLQISAFTLAHTLTLGAAVYGVVRLSPSIVEPLIALSIAWVAIENLWTSELKPWRTALVFAFGLLHGLGFAGVLAEVGVPPSRFLAALLSFNLGVEAGQLTVVAGAFLLVGARFSQRSWYRQRVVLPASLAIAAIGVWWLVERTLLAA